MRIRYVKNKDKELDQAEKDSYCEEKDRDILEEKDTNYK